MTRATATATHPPATPLHRRLRPRLATTRRTTICTPNHRLETNPVQSEPCLMQPQAAMGSARAQAAGGAARRRRHCVSGSRTWMRRPTARPAPPRGAAGPGRENGRQPARLPGTASAMYVQQPTRAYCAVARGAPALPLRVTILVRLVAWPRGRSTRAGVTRRATCAGGGRHARSIYRACHFLWHRAASCAAAYAPQHTYRARRGCRRTMAGDEVRAAACAQGVQ